jgi:antitoxin (DNA-binding transcriptional repressor) of toxin-antitoxin stability system
MAIKTVRSEEARNSFCDILDDAIAGDDIVIERYGKPTAVVVNYTRWQMQRRQWLAMLDERAREIDAGDFMTQEEVDAQLKARGIIP